MTTPVDMQDDLESRIIVFKQLINDAYNAHEVIVKNFRQTVNKLKEDNEILAAKKQRLLLSGKKYQQMFDKVYLENQDLETELANVRAKAVSHCVSCHLLKERNQPSEAEKDKSPKTSLGCTDLRSKGSPNQRVSPGQEMSPESQRKSLRLMRSGKRARCRYTEEQLPEKKKTKASEIREAAHHIHDGCNVISTVQPNITQPTNRKSTPPGVSIVPETLDVDISMAMGFEGTDTETQAIRGKRQRKKLITNIIVPDSMPIDDSDTEDTLKPSNTKHHSHGYSVSQDRLKPSDTKHHSHGYSVSQDRLKLSDTNHHSHGYSVSQDRLKPYDTKHHSHGYSVSQDRLKPSDTKHHSHGNGASQTQNTVIEKVTLSPPSFSSTPMLRKSRTETHQDLRHQDLIHEDLKENSGKEIKGVSTRDVDFDSIDSRYATVHHSHLGPTPHSPVFETKIAHLEEPGKRFNIKKLESPSLFDEDGGEEGEEKTTDSSDYADQSSSILVTGCDKLVFNSPLTENPPSHIADRDSKISNKTKSALSSNRLHDSFSSPSVLSGKAKLLGNSAKQDSFDTSRGKKQTTLSASPDLPVQKENLVQTKLHLSKAATVNCSSRLKVRKETDEENDLILSEPETLPDSSIIRTRTRQRNARVGVKAAKSPNNSSFIVSDKYSKSTRYSSSSSVGKDSKTSGNISSESGFKIPSDPSTPKRNRKYQSDRLRRSPRHKAFDPDETCLSPESNSDALTDSSRHGNLNPVSKTNRKLPESIDNSTVESGFESRTLPTCLNGSIDPNMRMSQFEDTPQEPPSTSVKSERTDSGEKVQTNTPHELDNSFDRLPKKQQSNYAYVEVVRKQAERRRLQGFTCRDCVTYYKGLELTDDEIQERINKNCRHRARYKAPDTPEHYWDVGFPDSQQCLEYMNTTQARPSMFRRRRGLKKLFKTEDEEKNDGSHGKENQ